MAQWFKPRAAASAPVDPAPTEAANLKLWLRMAATDSGAYIADASGNGNYVTQGTAGAQCSVTGGIATLDGGDNADTTNSALFNGATNWIISAWIWPTQHVNYAGVFCAQTPPLSGLVLYGSGAWACYVSDQRPNNGAYTAGTWTHIVSFFRQTGAGATSLTMQNWANGVMVALTQNNNTTTPNIGDVWRLGYDDGQTRFRGYIDDVRVYINPSGTNIIPQIYAEGRR
jgi:hypothetical protein